MELLPCTEAKGSSRLNSLGPPGTIILDMYTMFYNTWQLARMLARASESGYYKVHRHHGRTSLESDIMDFWGNLQVQAQKCADNVDDL